MINFLFLNGARSEIYTVGDEEEWNADADFVSWSQKYKLSVGDVLRMYFSFNIIMHGFTYVKGQHNTYEVTEDTYRSCNVSSGVLAKYESGNDQIKLKQAKKYWFICNVPGHCLGGMRFSIDVKEASATSGANSTRATITPPTESSSPLNSCKIHAPVRWSMGINLMAFGILVRLYF
nr:blue copper protein [Quercus suber]